MRTRQGGCHCGAVRFEARVPEPLRGGRCNCSICAKKGVLMVHVALDDLVVTQGSDVMATYSFNTGAAKHHFCPKCGVHVYHQPRLDPSIYAINAAALDGVCPYADFPEANVYDGVHHQKDHGEIVRSAGTLRFEPNPELRGRLL